jgi:hypothetical protein
MVPNEPNIASIKQFLGPSYEQLNVAKHSISEIENSDAMRKLAHSWTDGSFALCLTICGNPIETSMPYEDSRNRSEIILETPRFIKKPVP